MRGVRKEGKGRTGIVKHTCTCSCTYTCTLTQSGQQLHKDLSLEELWEGALDAYGRNEWQSTVDLLEEALKLYSNYENQTFQCLLQCQEEGKVESGRYL